MTKVVFELRTGIRKPTPEREAAYCRLGNTQPLLLIREPGNPVDPNAVALATLTNVPVGYVFKEHAAEVAARLARGEPLLARADGPCMCIYRRVYVWLEAEEQSSEEPATRQAPFDFNRLLDVPGVRTPEKGVMKRLIERCRDSEVAYIFGSSLAIGAVIVAAVLWSSVAAGRL